MTSSFCLKCSAPLILFLASLPSMAVTNNWHYQLDQDPMTDQSIQLASVKSDDNEGMLTVRCTNTETLDIFFSLGRYQYLGDQIFKTQYRVDKHKAVTE